MQELGEERRCAATKLAASFDESGPGVREAPRNEEKDEVLVRQPL